MATNNEFDFLLERYAGLIRDNQTLVQENNKLRNEVLALNRKVAEANEALLAKVRLPVLFRDLVAMSEKYPNAVAAISCAINGGRKIALIKEVRAMTGKTLKEAKDMVETWGF